MQSNAPSTREQGQAQRQVERFILRFEPSYRQLAYYAALPLVLTPELLHYLRNQFLRHIQLPWVAEADLLLSDLCYPVGYEQYAMDTAVRAYLMTEMEQELGAECLQAVAKLLLRYVQHQEIVNPYLSRQDLQAQQWAAMIYVDDNQRQKVARQLAQAYQLTSASGEAQRLSASAHAEMARLSRLTAEMAPKLQAYPELLDYARVVGRLLTDPQKFSPKNIKRSYPVMDGVELEVPADLVPATKLEKDSFFKGFPLLTDFEFTDLQLEETKPPADFPPALESETFTVLALTRESTPKPTPEPAEELEPFEITIATLVQVDNQWQLRRQQQTARRYIELLELLPETLPLEMVAIPGSTFTMGSPEDEPERYNDESPQHEATVESFFMGRYPITQAQWRAIAAMTQVDQELDPELSNFKGDNHPVEQVSWYDAIEFCARISVHTGREYRLPTEAEWEYACRAGTTTPFHFGDMITTEVANYNGIAYAEGPEGESQNGTTPVDHFGFANAFGLSDMHGNVWEWCQDHWHDNYDSAPTDGSAWEDPDDEETERVQRGGSWDDFPRYCRSACRLYFNPDIRDTNFGFRVVCSAPRILP